MIETDDDIMIFVFVVLEIEIRGFNGGEFISDIGIDVVEIRLFLHKVSVLHILGDIGFIFGREEIQPNVLRPSGVCLGGFRRIFFELLSVFEEPCAEVFRVGERGALLVILHFQGVDEGGEYIRKIDAILRLAVFRDGICRAPVCIIETDVLFERDENVLDGRGELLGHRLLRKIRAAERFQEDEDLAAVSSVDQERGVEAMLAFFIFRGIRGGEKQDLRRNVHRIGEERIHIQSAFGALRSGLGEGAEHIKAQIGLTGFRDKFRAEDADGAEGRRHGLLGERAAHVHERGKLRAREGYAQRFDFRRRVRIKRGFLITIIFEKRSPSGKLRRILFEIDGIRIQLGLEAILAAVILAAEKEGRREARGIGDIVIFIQIRKEIVRLRSAVIFVRIHRCGIDELQDFLRVVRRESLAGSEGPLLLYGVGEKLIDAGEQHASVRGVVLSEEAEIQAERIIRHRGEHIRKRSLQRGGDGGDVEARPAESIHKLIESGEYVVGLLIGEIIDAELGGICRAVSFSRDLLSDEVLDVAVFRIFGKIDFQAEITRLLGQDLLEEGRRQAFFGGRELIADHLRKIRREEDLHRIDPLFSLRLFDGDLADPGIQPRKEIVRAVLGRGLGGEDFHHQRSKGFRGEAHAHLFISPRKVHAL